VFAEDAPGVHDSHRDYSARGADTFTRFERDQCFDVRLALVVWHYPVVDGLLSSVSAKVVRQMLLQWQGYVNFLCCKVCRCG